MKQLWTEAYRPKTIGDYVFTNQAQRDLIGTWIKDQAIPHIILAGSPGTGKTSLAKVLLNDLNIEDYDILIANGSKEARKIEWVDTLISFCQTMPFGKFKVVLIDEADFMGANSVQPALRHLMEEYSDSVRFILTCNYPNRLLPAIHSRCHLLQIEKCGIDDFTARAATVLLAENVDFDLDVLDNYVKATYPDLRKCLTLLQPNSASGSLVLPDKDDVSVKDYKLDAVSLFKSGKILEARKLICSQIASDDLDEFFRWAYNNLDLWSSTQEGQDEAILIIRNGLVNHAVVSDAEINISAMLCELTQINT